MFPLVNVDGHRAVVHGKYCIRTNQHGVDLNRNWDDHWDGSTVSDTDTYAGKSAFSEEETAILRSSALNFKPDLFISIHSGVLGMYTPYAYSSSSPSSPIESTMVDILNKLNPKFCDCSVGAAGKEVGYLCPGTCLDYMFDNLKTPYSFAVEIYTGDTGYRGDKQEPMENQGDSKDDRKDKDKDNKDNKDDKGNSKTDGNKDADKAGSSLIQSNNIFKRLSSYRNRNRNRNSNSNSDSDSNIDIKRDSDGYGYGSCFLVPPPPFSSVSPFSLIESKHRRRIDQLSEGEGQEGDDEGVLFPTPETPELHSCLSTFNPTTKQEYDDTINNWSQALIALVNEVHQAHQKLSR